ncbi:hypothetical protein CLAFUW4_08015, partial [Fulvia fulva]
MCITITTNLDCGHSIRGPTIHCAAASSSDRSHRESGHRASDRNPNHRQTLCRRPDN